MAPTSCLTAGAVAIYDAHVASRDGLHAQIDGSAVPLFPCSLVAVLSMGASFFFHHRVACPTGFMALPRLGGSTLECHHF
eukprot:3026306-Amphidinium_carterae.1